jgi:carbon-monoxide dehydrogenase catalytic subunit
VVFHGKLFPVMPGTAVHQYLTEGIAADMGGRWAVENDAVSAAELIAAHIEKKRDALGINKERERKLFGMEDRQQLKV